MPAGVRALASTDQAARPCRTSTSDVFCESVEERARRAKRPATRAWTPSGHWRHRHRRVCDDVNLDEFHCLFRVCSSFVVRESSLRVSQNARARRLPARGQRLGGQMSDSCSRCSAAATGTKVSSLKSSLRGCDGVRSRTDPQLRR